MTKIEALLKENGPMISSELVRRLSVLEGITINTASQRISRDSTLERLDGFFKSNQSVLFLPGQREGGEVLKFVSQEMWNNGKKYWFTLNAVRYNAGVISRKFLETYSSYPIDPVKSHLTFDQVMQNFVKEKILVFDRDVYSLSPKLFYKGTNSFLSQTLESIKLNVLDNFMELARNIGWVSYDSSELFSTYGNFKWAFKGVSPVRGLRSGKNFGFVIGDILLGRPTYKRDVEFFIRKLQTVQSFRNASRVMPVMLVDSLDKEALMFLKEQGVIIGFIKELFGEKYSATLNDLITILTNAAASLTKNPNKYLELITELRKYNQGLLKNIKGALFEYVAGHYFIEKNATIQMGWKIYDNGATHEIDVLATFHDRIIIAECKGRIAPTPIDDVNKFIVDKIPAFRTYIGKQNIYRNKQVEFEYWSAAGYTEEALVKIAELESGYTRSIVRFLRPKDIMGRAKEIKSKRLQDELSAFFLKSDF